MTLFPKQLTYVKEFDSIRAIAVLLVILAHWFSGGITVGIYIQHYLQEKRGY
jgi:peptidoglycan/LPS O-acetylase OafA/YrhL